MRGLALKAAVAEVVGPVHGRLVEPAVARHAQDAVDEDDVAVLLEVVQLGLVADPLLGEARQRLAQLGGAAKDLVASEERLPHDVLARDGEERIEPSGLVRLPKVAYELDLTRHQRQAKSRMRDAQRP